MMMTEVINSIIDEWDPLDLFPFAPKDEYRDESILIFKAYMKTKNVPYLALEIHKIFSDSFGKDVFTKSMADCIRIAELIVENI
jgi:hypothetical protein